MPVQQTTEMMDEGKTLLLRRDMNKAVLPKNTGAIKTNILLAFLSKGYPDAGTPLHNKSFLSNEELLRKLERQCNSIDFIVEDFTGPNANPESLAWVLENQKNDLDGIVLVGFGISFRDNRWISSGLPTLVVYNLFEFMHVPYEVFDYDTETESVLRGRHPYQADKILTAELDRNGACQPSVSLGMFDDFVYKIKLMQALKKVRQSKVLVLAPQEALAEVDYRGDKDAYMPKDRNQTYSDELKESLGVDLVIRPPSEFYKAYQDTNEKEAENLSKTWIQQAHDVQASPSEIMKTARAYLALEALRVTYDCNAVSTHLRKVRQASEIEHMFWPGLAIECGFKVHGIQATSKNYPNIVVSQLLAYFLTGRPSMLGDLIIDPANSVTILTHCGAPVSPYGNDSLLPFSIKTHAESPIRETTNVGSGTALHIEWPAGEPVTIWKVYVEHRKIGLYTAQTVNAHSVYPNGIENILCRTKLVAEVADIQKLQNHYSPTEYGIHRTATLGDLRTVLKDVGAFLGYTVIEEDR